MNNINVILVSPSLPENIGMVARASLNFQISTLYIVSPKSSTWQDDACKASVGAFDTLNIKEVNSLSKALEDSTYTFGFSVRKRDMEISSYSLNNINQLFLQKYFDSITCKSQITSKVKNINLVFGNEANGLSNLELSYCDCLVHIDTNKSFSSLNLSHAVAIVLHYIKSLIENSFDRIDHERSQNFIKNKSKLANMEEIDNISNYLCNQLSQKQFFVNEAQSNNLKKDVISLMKRSCIKSKDIRMLFKILKTFQ